MVRFRINYVFLFLLLISHFYFSEISFQLTFPLIYSKDNEVETVPPVVVIPPTPELTREEIQAKLDQWRNDPDLLLWTDADAHENSALYANRIEFKRDDILDGIAH